MFNITRGADGVFYITFESWCCPNDADPVISFVKAASRLSHANVRIIDDFFEYEISCDKFSAVLCWSGGFSIMAFVKREIEKGISFAALKNVCAYMNGEQMEFF